MGRAKKLLVEYGQNVTEISHSDFDNADRLDDLTLTCTCGIVYTSTKAQVCRRLNKSVKLNCRSCVNKENRGKQ